MCTNNFYTGAQLCHLLSLLDWFPNIYYSLHWFLRKIISSNGFLFNVPFSIRNLKIFCEYLKASQNEVLRDTEHSMTSSSFPPVPCPVERLIHPPLMKSACLGASTDCELEAVHLLLAAGKAATVAPSLCSPQKPINPMGGKYIF